MDSNDTKTNQTSHLVPHSAKKGEKLVEDLNA